MKDSAQSMSTQTDINRFYRKWASRWWQTEDLGYEPARLAQIAACYKKFRRKGGWNEALGESLKSYSKTVIKPWLGPCYEESGNFRTMILLREYPLPVLVKGAGLLPVSRGEEPICSEIMRLEIKQVREKLDRSPYRTLLRACRRAFEIEQRVRLYHGMRTVQFDTGRFDRIVVTDLVKAFAIFRGATLRGRPFDPSSSKQLTRRSMHSKNMYGWALKHLEEEIRVLQPDLVVSFVGNTGWACADVPRENLDRILNDYKDKLAFCSHPGARGPWPRLRWSPGWQRK